MVEACGAVIGVSRGMVRVIFVRWTGVGKPAMKRPREPWHEFLNIHRPHCLLVGAPASHRSTPALSPPARGGDRRGPLRARGDALTLVVRCVAPRATGCGSGGVSPAGRRRRRGTGMAWHAAWAPPASRARVAARPRGYRRTTRVARGRVRCADRQRFDRRQHITSSLRTACKAGRHRPPPAEAHGRGRFGRLRGRREVTTKRRCMSQTASGTSNEVPAWIRWSNRVQARMPVLSAPARSRPHNVPTIFRPRSSALTGSAGFFACD